MTRIVNREVRALEQAGIRVVRLEPCAEDLAAFGSNLMSPRRRRRVFDTAANSAKEAVSDALLGLQKVASVTPSRARAEQAVP